MSDTQEGERPRNIRWLLGGWAAWWAALPVLALWTPVTLFLRLKERLPGQAKLVVRGEDALSLNVLVNETVHWSWAVSGTELVAWVAGPPLLMWVLWIWRTARTGRHAGQLPDAPGEALVLPRERMTAPAAATGDAAGADAAPARASAPRREPP